MVSSAGRYRNRRGSEVIAIDNDGRLLVVAIRGLVFAGQDFDALAPTDGPFRRTLEYLCPEFERRGTDRGYRGSFPARRGSSLKVAPGPGDGADLR